MTRTSYAAFAPAGLALWAAAACASPPAPPPESAARTEAEATARAAEATPPPAAAEPDPVREKVVVVEEGGAPARPSLGEAAAAARAARAGSEPAPPARRITNDNLAEVARDGRVTFAGPDAGAPLAGGAEPAAGPDGVAAAPGEARGEAYWRGRARDLRVRWRDTLDEIDSLRTLSADLRWRFYAEDDPWLRDSRIKPQWDDALERLRRAETAAHGFREEVDALLEEGRRAGALPGWLREGIELEPAGEAGEETADPAEPIDPVVVDERGEGSL